MKSRSLFRFSPVCLAATGLLTLHPGGNAMAAAGSYWNPDGTGGDGNWGTSPGEKNWNAEAGGPSAANTFWQDGLDELAVFQDTTGGIVTVIDTVQTSGIRQTGAGYTINAGTIVLAPGPALERPFADVQAGTLTIDSLLDGSAGLLKSGAGDLVLTRDTAYTGLTTVAAGRLVIASALASPELVIGPGAELLNQSGGLRGDLVLANSGKITLSVDDTISTYVSNGGTLASAGSRLSAEQAELNGGSVISGSLRSGSITTDGPVLASGRMESAMIDVRSGVLTNTGTLDSWAGRLNIRSGATLVAGGTQRYGLLTTSGGGAGTWQGDLVSTSAVAPGGAGLGGTLRVGGDFTNTAGGILRMDVSQGNLDRLEITGSAMLGGTLELGQPTAPITAFVPVPLVAAGSYAGNFSSLVETLDGTVFFNPGDGTVTRLAGTGAGESLDRLTANQRSTWIALYDDVVDPGVVNITAKPGGVPPYLMSSGIADPGNPDLLWTLAASIVPGGLDQGVLNHLSGEVYVSLADYATQATRLHQRTALSAPSLGLISGGGAKRAKGGLTGTPAARPWELFAAADFFTVETDDSNNNADYELQGAGFIAGARTRWNERIRVATYLGVDDGSIDGSLIDADGTGFTMGVIGEWMFDGEGDTRVTAAFSFGGYGFDGSRSGVSATAAGWSPGEAGFSDVGSTSFEWFLGVDQLLHAEAGLRFSVSAGLRYAFGSMDGFEEYTTAQPGAPVALEIGRDGYGSLLGEAALRVENRLNGRLALHGALGINFAVHDESHGIRSRFATGSRGMTATAGGLNDDLLFLSLGGIWRVNERVNVSADYRAEVRGDHEALNALGVSSSFAF